MKLRLPTLLCSALLACMTAAHADTYITDGATMGTIELDRSDYIYKADISSDATNRLYDGGKGRDWDAFASAAYGVYAENGKNLNVFGDLASSISLGSYSLNLDNLKNDSGHCWAYTGSNMIQYWQSYYGVFANKVGETTNPTPVHGFNYDTAYAATLGGTQQLKLNKLFYDSWEGSYGGTTSTAFDWYLGGKNDSSYLVDANSGGYFTQYFTTPNATTKVTSIWNTSAAGTISEAEFAESFKSHFGYTKQEDGTYKQTTKGQILYLELVKNPGVAASSHAITCYGFDTDADGNITALYIVNSDDAQHKIVKLYGKLTSAGYQLYTDEACSLSWNNWRLTGWSSIDTPEVLQNMLAEYESGKLTWMGNLSEWKNTSAEANPNVLPTDETGWMVYAGTGDHAGYYNSYYSAGRGVAFNDEASSGTVAVAEDLTVGAMDVNNNTLNYNFTGTGQTITAESLSKSGTGSLVFDGVKLYASGSVTANGGSITFKDDANFWSIDESSLIISGGTTTIRDDQYWTNLKDLALSEAAAVTVGASLKVAGNISTTEAAGALDDSLTSGLKATYCIVVGTEGDTTTGNVELAGSMSAGAYIKIQGSATIGGDLTARGTGGEQYISIGGDADIGGNLSSRDATTIGGDATIGGVATVDGNLTAGGTLTLEKGGTIGGAIRGQNIILKGDTSFKVLGDGTDNASTLGETTLTVSGGSATSDIDDKWTNLKALEISDQARMNFGASVCVAENISTCTATGTLASGVNDGLHATYCIAVGSAGKANTGNITLAGDVSAGAYITALGNVNIDGGLTAGQYVSIGGDASVGGTLSVTQNLDVTGALTLSNGGSVGGTASAGSLTLASGKTLTATGGLIVKGALAGEGGAASAETTGSMALGGSVSNMNLKAAGISVAAEQGDKLTLDAVNVTLTSGELSLSHVDVRGDSSFVATAANALTMRLEGVTFVLDGSNSTGVAQAPLMLTGDPLTQTEVGGNAFYINSDMLGGVNVSGSLTLDLSHWESEINSGKYDSVVLAFADGVDFSQAEEVQVKLGSSSLAMSLNADAPNSFTATLSSQPGEAVPEPTTATLSLLALAACAARRRRRAAR